jgi:hypothetical protein
LPVGHYSVVAVGFNATDLNGNETIPGWQTSVQNTGVGLISFVGTGRYDSNTSLDFPTTVPSGTPTNVFNAGTFQFQALAAPTISKSFGAAAIPVGGTTSLTFTLTNPNTSVALSGIAFTDVLPTGLLVATPNGLTSSCGGTITAVVGTNTVSLSGATLVGGASCTLSVNVVGTTDALANNTTGPVTTTIGVTGTAATASIVVGSVFEIGYAANMNIGDSVVNLSNSGFNGGFETAGNICANVYVFSEDQQLVSCCTCPLTPNHLKTLSVRNDLISNTLTPGVPIGVTIALLASQATTCNASTAGTTPNPIVPGLVSFGATIHANPDGTYKSSNYPLAGATLSATELTKLTSYCGFIQANGSGYGICKSCRQGAAGADRQ